MASETSCSLLSFSFVWGICLPSTSPPLDRSIVVCCVCIVLLPVVVLFLSLLLLVLFSRSLVVISSLALSSSTLLDQDRSEVGRELFHAPHLYFPRIFLSVLLLSIHEPFTWVGYYKSISNPGHYQTNRRKMLWLQK